MTGQNFAPPGSRLHATDTRIPYRFSTASRTSSRISKYNCSRRYAKSSDAICASYEEQAAGMLTWPHSGFHVHTTVWVPEDDRAFATRLARYCARNPVALERLTYDRTAKAVTYRSDKSEGPTAGTETVNPLEFLARVLVHIPDKGHVTTRYYGWYANRPRGMRRQAEPVALEALPVNIPAPRLAPTEAARRWATLLQQIFEVDPLACPTCRGPMRIIACITQASVIDQILTHLRTREAHRNGGGRAVTRRAARRWMRVSTAAALCQHQ